MVGTRPPHELSLTRQPKSWQNSGFRRTATHAERHEWMCADDRATTTASRRGQRLSSLLSVPSLVRRALRVEIVLASISSREHKTEYRSYRIVGLTQILLQYSCRSLHRNPFRSEFGRKVESAAPASSVPSPLMRAKFLSQAQSSIFYEKNAL